MIIIPPIGSLEKHPMIEFLNTLDSAWLSFEQACYLSTEGEHEGAQVAFEHADELKAELIGMVKDLGDSVDGQDASLKLAELQMALDA